MVLKRNFIMMTCFNFLFLISLSIPFLYVGTITDNDILSFWMNSTFQPEFNYIYTELNSKLTTYEILVAFINFWYSNLRLLIIGFSFYLFLSTYFLYFWLQYISKCSFEMLTESYISVGLFNFLNKNSFGNLIPGYIFWHSLFAAIYHRYSKFGNYFIAYNGVTITWSKYSINKKQIDDLFNSDIYKQINLNNVYTSDICLSKFFKKCPKVLEYKEALLEGNLQLQTEIFKSLTSFERKLVLQSQALVFMNIFAVETQNTYEFFKDSNTQLLLRNHFFTISEFFSDTLKASNNYIVSGKFIGHYPLLRSPCNLHPWYKKYESFLSNDYTFNDEAFTTFRGRLHQSYNCLGESEHLIRVPFENALIFYPSQTGIRSDTILAKIDKNKTPYYAELLGNNFPNKYRYSFDEIKQLLPNSYLFSIDVTAHFQRKLYISKSDVQESLLGAIEKKTSFLLRKRGSQGLLPIDYCIASDITLFKSNVKQLNIDEAFVYESIEKKVRPLMNKHSFLSLDIQVSIIDDTWNL